MIKLTSQPRRAATLPALAEQGNDAFAIRDYLGHRSVSTTNIYVASSPARVDRVWR